MQGRYGGDWGHCFDGRGRTQYVRNFLQGSDAGDSSVWVKDVGPLGVNGKEGRGDTRGVPATDHR